MAKIVVALSGGVDSSVAALLLKTQGHEVIGIFMRFIQNWEDTEQKECPWLEDSIDAMLVTHKLNIPFHIVDISIEYKKLIIDYMFNEYSIGSTPNPDILCNSEIKFNLFLQKALALNADFIATGQYARIKTLKNGTNKFYRLLTGVDSEKDQSYFLCKLNQYQLSKTIFPIGNFSKNQVRTQATVSGLVTASKKDSQGLCFVGKVHFPYFLQQKFRYKKGDVIEIPKEAKVYLCNESEKTLRHLAINISYNANMGKYIGHHYGAHFFTKGQRQGLHIGGYPQGLFVIATDINKNIVYVGLGRHHPGLYKKALFIKQEDIHWLLPDLTLKNGEYLYANVRIRYQQPLSEAILKQTYKGLFILFKKPQLAITEGQFAAWYIDEDLIGSGVIS